MSKRRDWPRLIWGGIGLVIVAAVALAAGWAIFGLWFVAQMRF